jgi:uncharacterized protein with HEPN domain
MKDDRLYLIHIRETLARIKKFTGGGKQEFIASELIRDATIRNLQVLTESTQRLSGDFKQQHSDINWQGMAGFRNVLVHGYLSIDLELVWDVIKHQIPELRRKLQEVFRGLPSPPKTSRKKQPKKSTKKPKKRKS